MATPFTSTPGNTGAGTIGATVFSLPNGSTTLTVQTVACELEVFVDLSAMAAGDQYRVQVVETVNGTLGVAWEAFPTGVQVGPLWVPPRRVGTGWDVRVKLIAGSARTVGWTINKDVGDVNTLTIANSAITATKFSTDAIDSNALAASAISEIQSGLALAATALSTAQWTNGRAANLDSLDTTVSSRASSTDASSLITITNAIGAAVANVQGRLPAALVGGNMPAAVQSIAASAITAAATAGDFLSAVAGQVMGSAIATAKDFAGSPVAITLTGATRLLLAGMIGKLAGITGLTAGSPVWRDPSDTKDVIRGTVTTTGRSVVLVDPT